MPSTANLELEVLAGSSSAPPAPVNVAAALAVAVAGIQADSVIASESYLRDTVVPHGGE